jgi:hypothetical protein
MVPLNLAMEGRILVLIDVFLGHDARRKDLQKGLTKGKMRAGVERKGNHTKTKEQTQASTKREITT